MINELAAAAAPEVIKKIPSTIRKISQKFTLESGTAFITYLNNTSKELNFKKTLASGDTALCITGENNMYVDIGAYYNIPGRQEPIAVDTSSVPALLSVNPNAKKVIVVGTGGAGKSMLMRYLFLDTVNQNTDDFIPVYIELSKIRANSEQKIDMRSFVRDSMDSYGKIDLSDDVFEYSLEQGYYIFLFDGFDEIKEELTPSVTDALRKFSAKYPNNAFIISSRERLAPQSLSAFQTVHTLELSKDKAIELAKKFPGAPDKVSAFCKNLQETWYDFHREFAENPLLLTMMFITFEQNGNISNRLADFYQDCFNALYSKHDAVDKTGYQRAFHCDISEHKFQKVFSHFCFHTWRQEIYSFSEDEILTQLAKSIQKFNLHISEEDYLKDLTESLCLVTFEGHRYRFAHRSFQTYFAAKYTCTLLDEQQNEFLTKKFNLDCENYDTNYLTLLDQLEHDRFLNNIIEPTFQYILSRCPTEQTFCVYLLSFVDIFENLSPLEGVFHHRMYLIIRNLMHFMSPTFPPISSFFNRSKHAICFSSAQQLCKTHPLICSVSYQCWGLLAVRISLKQLLDSNTIDNHTKMTLYQYISEEFQIPKMYQTIKDWLSEREALHQRENQVQDNFFDSL